nr:MAG TPA: Exonuclease [Bacteriophage sp.]
MGVNPWVSPYELYHRKIGDVPAPDISDKPAVHWGTILENEVAREFTRRTGYRVARRGTLQDMLVPYRIANVDRIIPGECAGLECKTTSAYSADAWADGKIPLHYLYQCLHYMLVLFGDAAGDICADVAARNPRWYIACLIGGQDYVYREIRYKDHIDDVRALAAAESDFFRRVQEHDEPPVTGSSGDTKVLETLNDGTGDRVSDLDAADIANLAHAIEGTNATITELKNRVALYKNQIIQLLGNTTGIVTGRYRVTYTAGKPRESVDMKRLRNNGALYNNMKGSGLIKKTPGSKVLRIKYKGE